MGQIRSMTKTCFLLYWSMAKTVIYRQSHFSHTDECWLALHFPKGIRLFLSRHSSFISLLIQTPQWSMTNYSEKSLSMFPILTLFSLPPLSPPLPPTSFPLPPLPSILPPFLSHILCLSLNLLKGNHYRSIILVALT